MSNWSATTDCGVGVGGACSVNCGTNKRQTGSGSCGFLGAGCNQNCAYTTDYVNAQMDAWVASNPKPSAPGSEPTKPPTPSNPVNINCCSQDISNAGTISGGIQLVQQCTQQIQGTIASAQPTPSATDVASASSSCSSDADCITNKINKYLKTCSNGACVYNKKNIAIGGGILAFVIVFIIILIIWLS